MPEIASKLGRLVDWVRRNIDSEGAFLKSAFYAYARKNDMERSALVFISRCRHSGTMRDVDNDWIAVAVPKAKSLEQYYQNLLKTQDKPILLSEPKPGPGPRKVTKAGKEERPKKDRRPAKEKEPEKPASTQTPSNGVSELANAVAQRLGGEFKRIDDRVGSVRSLVEYRISNLEKNATLPRVQQLEQRIKQLEKELEEFREKAEAFDLIKRDAWEIVQALDIVEVERGDLKKVLKKFLQT